MLHPKNFVIENPPPDQPRPKAIHLCPFCADFGLRLVQVRCDVVPHHNQSIVWKANWWTYDCTKCHEQFRSKECEILTYNKIIADMETAKFNPTT